MLEKQSLPKIVGADPLYLVAEHGHCEMTKLLFNKGADVNAKGGLYGNALQVASCEGHEVIAKLLLGKGADVNAHGGEYGNTLQAASWETTRIL